MCTVAEVAYKPYSWKIWQEIERTFRESVKCIDNYSVMPTLKFGLHPRVIIASLGSKTVESMWRHLYETTWTRGGHNLQSADSETQIWTPFFSLPSCDHVPFHPGRVSQALWLSTASNWVVKLCWFTCSFHVPVEREFRHSSLSFSNPLGRRWCLGKNSWMDLSIRLSACCLWPTLFHRTTNA